VNRMITLRRPVFSSCSSNSFRHRGQTATAPGMANLPLINFRSGAGATTRPVLREAGGCIAELIAV
jgi:hypothetical protein